MRFLSALIAAQERRRYHPLSFFLFCVFTGLMRGILELLVHDIALKNTDIANFIPFYLSLGLMLRELLARLTGASRETVEKSVIIGIFLGLFPPLIDALIPAKVPVFYGYYFLWDLNQLPWLGYNPRLNFPAGECITIWLSIVFCAAYVFVKTRSFFRTLAALIIAYAIFIFSGSGLPMLLFRWFVGDVQTIEAAQALDRNQLQIFTYRLAYTQAFLAACFWVSGGFPLLKYTLRRLLHGLPFLALALFGCAIAGETLQNTVTVCSALLLVIILSLWQNDHFDFRDDGRTDPPVTRFELQGLTGIFLVAAAFLFFMNQRSVIMLIVALVASILYNYPFYRARNVFPANIKIEGIWGLCAFMAGLLSEPAALERLPVKISALLVFGGWSTVSVWKDIKDFEADKAARVRTLFTVLDGKGFQFASALKSVRIIVSLLFTIPVALGGIYSGATAAAVLGGAGIFVLAFLWSGQSEKHFRGGLASLTAYILSFAALVYLKIWRI